MDLLANHFFVVVAEALFDLSPGVVAGAEGVLRFLARLADQSGVDQEEELAAFLLLGQQHPHHWFVEVVLLPTRAGQESGEFPAMDRFAGDHARSIAAAHPAAVHHERQDDSHHHDPGERFEVAMSQEGLESRSSFGDDNHRWGLPGEG